MGDNGKEQIGDYELVSLIGDGAQGRVYRARCVSDALPHVKKGEEVALKVVRITGEDEKLRLKFQEQADILRRLSHTNIVSYRDCFAWHAGEWDEAQCLVMELLEGETLSERLKNAHSGLPWPQVEEIFEQCLAGLIHARERGITHRDVKPSNIFIARDGKTKLIDFDIARRDDSGQMSTAGWKGTFDYMAPDFISINGFRGDEVSDIFSLGVCFYQALTGSLPYEPLGETAHIGYLNRWRNNAAPVPSFRPGVFRVLSNAKGLVAKSLAAKREERYATFAAMLEDFRKIRYRRIRHKNKDEYELLGMLGRGGFGEVFKARRVSDGMLVAVKYLFSEKQSDRFLREAKILQQYPHPNLVKYVDFMVLEGTAGEKQYFLVMEFLEGMPGWTLRHRLKNEGKLEVAEAIPLFGGYLSALQFLHGSARQIVHRDIKPGNLYAPMGQPDKGKIFDLGVARDVSGTVTVGGVPGTLDYMAPEFAETGNDRGSPQSDLYALALCLYESLAGKPVFERLPTDLNSAWLAFQDRIRKPPAIAFDSDAFVQYPRLKPVVSRALAEKPEARFRSAEEMRIAMEEALRPQTAAPQADDGFDVGEVTMATFSGAGPTQEPGATLGTRPIEIAQSGPGDLIEAGRQEADRRKRQKLMLIAGGAAAALLVFVGGGAWIGSCVSSRANRAEKRPARVADEGRSEAARQAQKPAATETPKAVQPAAAKTSDQAASEPPKKEPEKPAAPTADDAAKRAAAEKADAEKARLAEEQRVAAEKEAAAKTKAAADEKAAQAVAAADAGKRVDEFSARVQKGSLADCSDGVALLAGIAPTALANAELKAKWAAVRGAYVKLVEQTVAQKDPLNQRAQRLKTAEDVLGHASAGTFFGDDAAGLRKALEQQKGVCLVRMINRSANAVQVSGRDLKEKVELAGGETKELALPVSDETASVAVRVEGGKSFRSREEALKLSRASGVEWMIAALEAEPPPKVAEATKPVETPKPAEVPKPAAVTPTAPPATPAPAVQPAAAAATPPAAAPASDGKTALDITVSPKSAEVTVDGKVVPAGKAIDVTPNENHKVTVSCEGYKPVQQYYKVKPGETRKIDVLLEKEQKKSVFGF